MRTDVEVSVVGIGSGCERDLRACPADHHRLDGEVIAVVLDPVERHPPGLGRHFLDKAAEEKSEFDRVLPGALETFGLFDRLGKCPPPTVSTKRSRVRRAWRSPSRNRRRLAGGFVGSARGNVRFDARAHSRPDEGEAGADRAE
jgi:hypothetical protein